MEDKLQTYWVTIFKYSFWIELNWAHMHTRVRYMQAVYSTHESADEFSFKDKGPGKQAYTRGVRLHQVST